MDFLNVLVFLVSISASPSPNTSIVRFQTNPGLVSKYDIPPFCNGPILMSKSPVPAIVSVSLVQCKTFHLVFWNEDLPDAIFDGLFGLRYASLLPGWNHIRYVWQLMLGACEPTVGGNYPTLVFSYEDDHCEVYHSHFPSLYFLNILDTPLWVKFNRSATSSCVWPAESKITIWTISNGCMPLRGMSLQCWTQTEWIWCWYWTARGVRYVYMHGKRTQSMPVVNTVSNMSPDCIMNEVLRWMIPLES